MTKKSRRSRARRTRKQVTPQAAQAKPAVVEPDKPVASLKQTPSPRAQAGQEGRMRHLGSDIRRTFICAAVALIVLIILYLLLR